MKVKLVMRDTEYRDALAKRWSKIGWDLYVEMGEDFSREENEMIITDLGYGKLKPGMIYLHPEPRKEMEGAGPHTLFKYAGAESILRDVRICFYLWTGQGKLPDDSSFKILIGAAFRTDLCHQFAVALAEELSQQSELSILYLPFSYFVPRNGWGIGGNVAPMVGTVRKLGYYLEQKRDIALEMFFWQRPNRVYRLCSPDSGIPGVNELARITSAEQCSFVEQVSAYFDITVIMVGDCLNEGSRNLVEVADKSIFLGNEGWTESIRRLLLPADTDTGEGSGSAGSSPGKAMIDVIPESEYGLQQIQGLVKEILEKIG